MELVGGGSIGGGGDSPAFEVVRKARPVDLLSVRSWFMVMGEREA